MPSWTTTQSPDRVSIMKQQVLETFEEVWKRQCAALEDALTESGAELQTLLRLDEYHRHGRDPEELERVLGPFASGSLDLGSLSRVLDESTRSRAMSAERLRRVQDLISQLEETKDALSVVSADSASVDVDDDEGEIRRRAEEHLDRFARVFRTLRVAQLEVRSRYESQTHDPVFSNFNWRQLGPGELRLCPPFLVVATLEAGGGRHMPKMISLFESGMPIKIAALRSGFVEAYATTADTRVPPTMTLETLPLAMRGVHFVQTCEAIGGFREQLTAALTAPRPSLISVLCPRDGESHAAFLGRAERALRARAFPGCVYDPDGANSFVASFDLSSNPSPDALWTIEKLSHRDSEGEPIEIEEPFTFAHFVVSEPAFEAEFTHPPPVDDQLVPMADYLEFSRRQQVGKLPFVAFARGDGGIIRRVVSPAVALQCAERLHLWRTLQEIAGIDNPHVHTSRATLEKELGAEHGQQLESLRQEMQKEAEQRAQAAVAGAVRKLVTHLTGVDPGNT